jgi:diguanylate cyclase (GGDEF)-like protein/PAS domain S-box-containing protein
VRRRASPPYEQRRLLPSLFQLVTDVLAAPLRRALRPAGAWRPGRLTGADFRRIIEALPVGVTVKDAHGRIVYANATDAELHGYRPDELVGRPAGALGPGHEPGGGATGRTMADPWRGISLNTRKSGEAFPVYLRSTPVRDRSGAVLGVVTTCEDMTDVTLAGERAALEDGLTGLASRTLFLELLERSVKRLKRKPESRFAVLYLDFRRFRVVNATFGHAMADRLLAGAAQEIKQSIRPTDVAARIVGDEFAVLIDGLGELTDATRVAARIIERFERALAIDGRDVYLTPTVGIAVSQPAIADPSQYLKDASLALRRARAAEAPFEVFDPLVHQRAVQRLQLESELRRAIEQEQLRVVYQPIVDLKSGRLVGLEALVRWDHPERGIVLPEDFIPAAEDTGLVIPIDAWVLRAACAQFAAWMRQFPRYAHLAVHVNLSARHLRQANIVEQVMQALAETGLPPKHLKLEVTESLLMEHGDAQVGVLRQLLAAGVGTVIDDFGTGYSSLNYLQRFPVDALKIDRSFLVPEVRGDGWEIVRMIIALARYKRAVVVAEGVEEMEQARRLQELGCDQAQGYLYSRPLPAGAVADLLRRSAAPEGAAD